MGKFALLRYINERVSTINSVVNFVVLITEDSESNHLDAQGTLNAYP